MPARRAALVDAMGRMKYPELTRQPSADRRVMIPAKIIRFLEDRANLGFAGTRDAGLAPLGHRLSAWRVDVGGRTISTFMRPFWEARFLESLRDNGSIALTIGEIATHETYQIKGRYVNHRPVQPVEIEMADRLRERLARALLAHYQDERIVPFVRASIPTPTLVVAIEVHEVFVQTPGPGAGERIAPPSDGR